jgi:putative endopeptidase
MSKLLIAAASATVLAWAGVAASGVAQAAEPAASAGGYGAWGYDLSGRDANVKPGDDFFLHANGGWYARTEIPADQARMSTGFEVFTRAQAQLREIIEASAKAGAAGGPNAQKVGALYSAFMDEAALEKLDDKPLQPDLAKIRALTGKAGLAGLMGRAQGGFGASFFQAGVQPDAKKPDVNALYLTQAGIGLPNRDYYLSDAYKAQKAAYRAHVQKVLEMVGWAKPAEAADAILAMETKVAEASWTLAEQRDTEKTYNPMSRAELKKLAPGFEWDAWLAGMGAGKVERVIVGEPTAFPKIAQVFADTPVSTLRAWEAFHTADQASPYLSKRFVDERFAFRGKALQGLQEQQPRWKRGVDLVNNNMGEAVGREYVAKYFPPESKAAMETLVANLRAAMKDRIERADWMSPQTKAQALEKLAKLRVKVGYPNKWRDYAGLKIDGGDLYGDVGRAAAFEWAFQVGKLGQPVDRDEWFMTPQTVDAYNNPLGNEIVFPAAILQPPFFNPKADPAVNYGAIGGVIGHEITHGFDDQGRSFDSDGVLRDWWTAEDAAKFKAEAAKLAAQYDAFEPVPGVHVKGQQTLGENIADMGGLLLGLEAYHMSLKGQPAPVIDGVTGDQRVFYGWAQGWRNKTRDEAIKQQLASDVHSPARFRVIGPMRNVDGWYAAFGVKEGDKYYLKPADRVRIW